MVNGKSKVKLHNYFLVKPKINYCPISYCPMSRPAFSPGGKTFISFPSPPNSSFKLETPGAFHGISWTNTQKANLCLQYTHVFLICHDF